MNLDGFVGIPYVGRHYCRVFASDVLKANGLAMPEVVKPEMAIDWVKVEIPTEMDVVVFSTSGKPDHVGVCIGRGRFIHVEEGCRSRIEYLSSPLWGAKIYGFYRYSGEK